MMLVPQKQRGDTGGSTSDAVETEMVMKVKMKKEMESRGPSTR